ncbi:hypothetical protein B9S53_24115 [Arthrospira sp. O9.13F]|nr:hypothetical protein B9S53_24115 [Arthrospira sp. O9.13F]
MSPGVVYIASGQKYIAEASQSAATLHEKMPQIPITLIASENTSNQHFEQVIIMENPQYSLLDKVQYMIKSPYDYTLFLDTDTYICEPFYELFELLEKFDIATSHEQTRISYQVDGVPDSFPEMNTGVILFKKSPQLEKVFQDWLNFYQRDIQKTRKPKHDQPAFREALYQNSEYLKIATLPPEYNCRTEKAVFIQGTVKIIHMHPKPERMELGKLAKYINKNKEIRVFIPGLGLINTRRWQLRFYTRYFTIILPMYFPRLLGWLSYRFKKAKLKSD